VAPYNLIRGTVPRGIRDCRSFVTPDSDPGSSLDSRVRRNDDGRDARFTGDCFVPCRTALPMTTPNPRDRVHTLPEETTLTEPTATDKRFFLKSLLFLLAALAAVMGAGGLGRFAFFKIGKSKTREVPKDVLDRLQLNTPLHVPDAGAWLLKRKEPEQLMAFDDRCTHLGCRQKWNPARGLFECPCHGSEFDLGGNVKRGPATRPMPPLFLTAGDNGKLHLLERPPAKSGA
jgi:nitrite reductase/ring-hydroxylating ferredoxin subunit